MLDIDRSHTDKVTPVDMLPNGEPDLNKFYPIAGVNTNAATSSDDALVNIRRNIKLGFPRLEQLPEFKKVKGNDVPIALVGGGPSVKKQIDKIKEFRTIIACGSAHDWVRLQGIVPTYATICDPDPLSVNYFQKLHTETKYLIATSADQKIIDHIKNHQLILWHCHSDDYNDKEIEENYQWIGGGCTVGLRSLTIAIMLGYCNIHFFGFDSCLGDNEAHHAYDYSDPTKEQLGQIYKIQIGDEKEGPEGKTYYCEGYHLAQADNFKMFTNNYGHLFVPTFHGEGLLPDFWKMSERLRARGLEKKNGT